MDKGQKWTSISCEWMYICTNLTIKCMWMHIIGICILILLEKLDVHYGK